MIPGLNPKKMQAVMKQMGISQDEIDAERVIIEKSDGSKIILQNPSVTKIKMQGQESFQITGDISDEEGEKFSEEDIKTIVEKTGQPIDLIKKTLEETGDMAETILKLSE